MRIKKIDEIQREILVFKLKDIASFSITKKRKIIFFQCFVYFFPMNVKRIWKWQYFPCFFFYFEIIVFSTKSRFNSWKIIFGKVFKFYCSNSKNCTMQRQESSYESFSLDEYTLDVEDFFNDYIIHKSNSYLYNKIPIP